MTLEEGRASSERLLSEQPDHDNRDLELQPSPPSDHTTMDTARKDRTSSTLLEPQISDVAEHEDRSEPQQYRTYKRRFVGLAVLVLLNIVVSWDWLTFSAVSTTSAEYFHVSENAINWLSTGFLVAFVVVSPVTMWTLNKGGPKASIMAAASLILVGNWIRYAGARATEGHFGVVVFGQVIIGFAQPFCLAAPTRYSDMWFSDTGRVSATAVASLANPLGGALGQLIGPLWATTSSGIPNMVLYTAIISSIASLPAFFIPSRPPTPPSASSSAPKLHFRPALLALAMNYDFFLVLFPFAVYVGSFNAFSSLINQILAPYDFSETQAGIAGGILILVGLIASAIISPLIDRTKAYLVAIKVLVPVIAIGYLIMIWVPETRSAVAAYVVCGLIGAASFALLPCALEYLVEITHPVSPEISSVVCWATAQLLGAAFVVDMGNMKGDWKGQPADNLKSALVFEAVVACAVVPLPLMLGWFKSRKRDLDRIGAPSLGAREQVSRALNRTRSTAGYTDAEEGPSSSRS
ncbi:hypothetical protein MBLNU457_g1076t2 [Dothideomycetes sp. NU457]